MRTGWRLATIFGIPGGIVSGLTGLVLLTPLGYGFRPGWVHASMTLWGVLLLLNLFYLAPRLKKTLAAAEASLAAGAPTVELQRLTSAKHPAILAHISALGVVVGFLISVAGKYFIEASTRLKIDLEPRWLLIGAGLGLVCGLAGALYPAIRAANLDPVEAISYE